MTVEDVFLIPGGNFSGLCLGGLGTLFLFNIGEFGSLSRIRLWGFLDGDLVLVLDLDLDLDLEFFRFGLRLTGLGTEFRRRIGDSEFLVLDRRVLLDLDLEFLDLDLELELDLEVSLDLELDELELEDLDLLLLLLEL